MNSKKSEVKLLAFEAARYRRATGAMTRPLRHARLSFERPEMSITSNWR